MKRYLFLVFCALFFFSTYGQTEKEYDVDLLLHKLQNSKDTLTNVSWFNEQIRLVYKSGIPKNKDVFLSFIKHTLEVAENIKDKEGIAWTNYYLARYHIAAISGYSNALPMLLKAKSNFEELENNLGVSQCLMQMGLISYVTQYYEDAIKNFKLSLDYHTNPTSTYLMAISYSELNQFKEAKTHFYAAIREFKSLNRLYRMDECYMYLGKLYVREEALDSAYYYLNKALDNLKKLDDKAYLTRPYALISEYYLKMGQLDVAEFYALSSIEYSKDANDQISPLIASEILSKVYEEKNDFKKSHFYLKMHYKLRNEEFQGGVKQKITEMQTIFEFKKKMDEENRRHEIEILEKNRVKNILLTSGLFVILLAGGLFSRLQFVRKSKKELQNEKNVSEKLLLNILPGEIAQELKEKGKTEARDFDMVSILFTDFKEFTEIAEKLTASELVSEINHCFEAFDGIIEKYNIEKIKTIGDAYMAAGGLPVPTNDSVKNTVLAALEMQDFINKRKAEMDALGKTAFEMRIGIHTGPVVAGIVGVKKFQYDIWGDTVNTASRMESSGEVGKVNISQATFELLKDDPDFTFESRGKIEAKGKGTLEMYFITRKRKEKS